MRCEEFCSALAAASGLGASYGRPAYRAMMAFGGLEAASAYRSEAERARVLQAVSPFVSMPWPATEAYPCPGALKFASRLSDGTLIESVILENLSGRRTLCLSTQAGCRRGCAFCATGAGGFRRDLSASEICAQAMSARRDFGASAASIVLMGMGEALDNYEASLAALRSLSDERGPGLAIRRMTLSTAGIAPGIERLAEEAPPRPNLALSLHAADDDLRSSLMPVNREYPLARLKRALRRYVAATGRAVFVEYLLLDGINDSDRQAGELARYLGDLPAKVNLMEYSDSGRAGFSPSPAPRAEAFRGVLAGAGIFVHPRRSKGSAVRAACGQLGTRSPLAG